MTEQYSTLNDFAQPLSTMAKPRAPSHPDRVIASGTRPAKGESGDANALWRYEKKRQRNALAQPGPHSVALVLDGLRADFNVPKIFCSAELLDVHAVHLVNVDPFDPAPAPVGPHRKLQCSVAASLALYEYTRQHGAAVPTR